MKRMVGRITLRYFALVLGLLLTQSAGAQTSASFEADKPMDPDAKPGFVVATVKPSDPNAPAGWAFPLEGNRVTARNATIENILMVAYRIHPKQVVDGPAWVTTDRYDVSGIPDVPGVPNFSQIQEMYRKLLADRFGMKFHREVRSIPVYALTVGKGGQKLKAAEPNGHLNAGNLRSQPGQRTMKFTSMSMADFVLNLNFYEDRPVVDQTALPGKYDFTLKWSYEISTESNPDAPPSLFTAIREQLGLRLDAVKGPAEVFVIDQLERPLAN